ncbi:MAG: hypothetical protein KZQ95_18265 [Candidatus Thiodiazotropha sp. (ex Epidulcina cf. delphinae)]|nr:hypothetical protein [Candidatus Thiodiazotropha sp. (ex Epidulcina cf. delphinae)]
MSQTRQAQFNLSSTHCYHRIDCSRDIIIFTQKVTGRLVWALLEQRSGFVGYIGCLNETSARQATKTGLGNKTCGPSILYEKVFRAYRLPCKTTLIQTNITEIVEEPE